jgi:hypothetical protein
MYEVNRKGTWFFHPFRRVDVFVGPQFETDGLTDKELADFAERLRQWSIHCLEHGRWPETTTSDEVEAASPAANDDEVAPATSAAR